MFLLKIFFNDCYYFSSQRCSVGTTLLDSTLSPALVLSATPQAVSPVQASTPSPAAEVSPTRWHICFFTLFQFATHGCVMLTRHTKMQFLRFTTKSHFCLSPFASRILTAKKQLQALLLITAICTKKSKHLLRLDANFLEKSRFFFQKIQTPYFKDW